MNDTKKRKIEKKYVLQAIAILCLGFLMICTSAITASLQLIGKMFPEVPYTRITLLETVPAFSSIPFCILSGTIAGRKVSFRLLSILGMAGYVIFGALPFFMTSFTAILICRLMLGASLGLMTPLGNSLMILTLPKEMVSTMVGLNLVVQNIGILILQNVANALVKIATPDVWLCYLIGIIPILGLVFLLKEPDVKAESEETKTGRTPLPGLVWPIGILFMLFAMFFMVSSSGVSQIVINDGVGTVDDVTTIFNANIIVSLLMGLAFGAVFSFTKKFTVYLGFIMCIIGLGIMGFSWSVGLLIVCAVILAAGYTLCCSSFMMEVNGVIPPAAIAIGTSVVASLSNLGVSLASEWYSFIGNLFGTDSMRVVMFFSAGGLIVVTAIHLFLQKPIDALCKENNSNLAK